MQNHEEQKWPTSNIYDIGEMPIDPVAGNPDTIQLYHNPVKLSCFYHNPGKLMFYTTLTIKLTIE